MDETESLTEFIKAVATPAGVAGVMILIVWRVGRWLGPIIEKLTDRHMAFMDHCAANDDKVNDRLDVIHGDVKALGTQMTAIHHQLTNPPNTGRAQP